LTIAAVTENVRAMLSRLEIIEILVRGMNAGATVILIGAFLARRPINWRQGLGALFAASAACYVLASSPVIIDAIGAPFGLLHTLAIFSGVFFWWFSLSLFDDGFRWRWPLFAPFMTTTPLFVTYFWFRENAGAFSAALNLGHATLVVVYAHAIYTALRYIGDDLVEGRRRFRILFAIAVPVMGLIIVFFEWTGLDAYSDRRLMLAQAVAILMLTIGFGLWLIDSRRIVLDGLGRAAAAPPPPAPQSGPTARLAQLMGEGAYREEGLSVAGLAEKVGVPEHQLRKLINGELGFRNFSAFLNSYRIDEAKAALVDPDHARKQILQIALDLGYGSIAPFNRAFKEATGKTPTEFRRAARKEL
jgi:AraC-like DNA-binding protein